MFEVRIHGRGGQGVVTAAEMLSIAGFNEGAWAQAIPSFGSERMGAPVVAFCRLNDTEIRAREPITSPDAVVIQDPTLLHQVKVFEGLSPTGYVLINSTRSADELGIGEFLRSLPPGHARTLAATEIAVRHIGRPVPNAVLLAGLCAISGQVKLASLEAAIRQKFKGDVGERNVAAAREAYALCGGNESSTQVRTTKGAVPHAQAV
ncbi:MAG TPA: 2-oxoacid:acceptor oxidoreductase family protein [Phycisphaerales bacterium]|nr:2-oxoacid:acceptor oxidoreductase family protein [Phycisphaerales bacterium]